MTTPSTRRGHHRVQPLRPCCRACVIGLARVVAPRRSIFPRDAPKLKARPRHEPRPLRGGGFGPAHERLPRSVTHRGPAHRRVAVLRVEGPRPDLRHDAIGDPRQRAHPALVRHQRRPLETSAALPVLGSVLEPLAQRRERDALEVRRVDVDADALAGLQLRLHLPHELLVVVLAHGARQPERRDVRGRAQNLDHRPPSRSLSNLDPRPPRPTGRPARAPPPGLLRPPPSASPPPLPLLLGPQGPLPSPKWPAPPVPVQCPSNARTAPGHWMAGLRPPEPTPRRPRGASAAGLPTAPWRGRS